MCGIIGATSYRDISSVLLEGLKRLEYRGYDSAGVAMVDDDMQLTRIRVKGKVGKLADALINKKTMGNLGIAHTRWATHGKPSEQNAHPHISNNEIAVVHNGIIENYELLRLRLKEQGYKFVSDTDTEIVAHLLHFHYQQNKDLLQAVWKAQQELEGAFALGVIHVDNPQELIGVRRGSPLVVGIGNDENFIASDQLALLNFAKSVIFLEDGDSVRLNCAGVEIFDAQNQKVERKIEPISEDSSQALKGNYRHFMLKEINEQSIVLKNLIQENGKDLQTLENSFDKNFKEILKDIKCVQIVACGTSYHAGLIAKYWIESLAKVPVMIDIASEYRYRDVIVLKDTLFVTVSQSGETADTLAALAKAKSLDYKCTFCICNVGTSSLVRESDFSFLTKAGVEIGVASTKAFTTQLACFLMLATQMCNDSRKNTVLNELNNLPQCLEDALKMDSQIEKIAPLFLDKQHALFLGRGIHFPVALEGALKLKEISYIHAEAYPSGELKHGPLALVDKDMPVFAVAPNDELLDKLKSNLHEVSARGGQLYVFVDNSQKLEQNGAKLIKVPACGSWVAPIIYTVPLQLLAYYVAALKGTDVDQPRNLAKSVTVE